MRMMVAPIFLFVFYARGVLIDRTISFAPIGASLQTALMIQNKNPLRPSDAAEEGTQEHSS